MRIVKQHLSNNKGFSLIEIMIVVTIVSMVTISLIALLSQSVSGWGSGTSTNNVNNTVSIAMQKMCNDIRDGRSATASSGVLTITYPLLVVDGTTQEKVYSSSSNSAYTVSYYRTSNNYLIRSSGGSSKTIATNIKEAVFGANGGSISIKLTAQNKMDKSITTQTLNGRVCLRNYKS